MPQPPTLFTLRSPGDLIAAVPILIGHRPQDSLVLVGLPPAAEGAAVSPMTIRTDLPSDADEAAMIARDVHRSLTANGIATVLVVGYGPAGPVTSIIDALRRELDGSNVTLHDAVRVAGSRYWSYLCTDPSCCPPEGVPFDTSTSAVTAHAVVQGFSPLPDRTALAATLAPLQGPARTRMRQVTRQAEQELVPLAVEPEGTAGYRQLIADATTFIAELADRARSGGAPTDSEVARLGLLLVNLRLRDEAWVRIDDDHLPQHVGFWRDVVRRVEERYAAAPATLLAYAAYATGDGGLANLALDRADTAQPGYRLGRLLRDLLRHGAPPKVIRHCMTPEKLAAARRDQRKAEPPIT